MINKVGAETGFCAANTKLLQCSKENYREPFKKDQSAFVRADRARYMRKRSRLRGLRHLPFAEG